MSEAITPLEAVEMKESYQELMDVITHCLSVLDMVVIDFNDPINDNDYSVGTDFSELELLVALNEFRAKGWEVEKIKNNIYQFSPAPIATIPMYSTIIALTPDQVDQKQTAGEFVDQIVELINQRLVRTDECWVCLDKLQDRRGPTSYYALADIQAAVQRFVLAGWKTTLAFNNDREGPYRLDLVTWKEFETWETFWKQESRLRWIKFEKATAM